MYCGSFHFISFLAICACIQGTPGYTQEPHPITSDPARLRLYRHSQPVIVCSAFVVPKSDRITGRFIWNGKQLNQACDIIWPCPLSGPAEVLAFSMQHDWATQADATSFFYQIPSGLPLGIIWHDMVFHLTRLPMGWKAAPGIAQHISMELIRDLPAYSHIDNFLLMGHTAEELTTTVSTFMSRCSYVNLELKAPPAAPAQTLVALGLHMDLVLKRHQLDPSWVASHTAYIQHWISARRGKIKVRSYWVALGLCIWTLTATLQPLAPLSRALQHASGLAKKIAAADITWETAVFLPVPAVDSVTEVLHLALANPWYTWKQGLPTVAISADASPMGWAASLRAPNLHLCVAAPWQGDIAEQAQIRREAEGLLHGLTALYPHVPTGGHIQLILHDCIPLLQILKKGNTRSPHLTQRMSAMRTLLASQFYTQYVCSKHHWNDAASRSYIAHEGQDVPSLGDIPFMHTCTGTCQEALAMDTCMEAFYASAAYKVAPWHAHACSVLSQQPALSGPKCHLCK